MRNVKFIFAIVIVLMLVGVAVHYTRNHRESRLSKAQKLAVRTLQEMTDGEISYEERSGSLMITVIDRYRDSHIYALDYSGMTREEALRTLDRKMKTLKK